VICHLPLSLCLCYLLPLCLDVRFAAAGGGDECFGDHGVLVVTAVIGAATAAASVAVLVLLSFDLSFNDSVESSKPTRI
jgi:hypothetical protein